MRVFAEATLRTAWLCFDKYGAQHFDFSGIRTHDHQPDRATNHKRVSERGQPF